MNTPTKEGEPSQVADVAPARKLPSRRDFLKVVGSVGATVLLPTYLSFFPKPAQADDGEDPVAEEGYDGGEVTPEPTPELTEFPSAPPEEQIINPEPQPKPEPTKTPEVRPAFKDIGDLQRDGFTIHNYGTRYGFKVNDMKVTYSPDGKPINEPGYAEKNLQVAKDLFKKYGQDPNLGKGRTLENFFYDNPTHPDLAPFTAQTRWWVFQGTRIGYYARLVGNNFQVYIIIDGQNFDLRSGAMGVLSLNAGAFMYLLRGQHEAILDPTIPYTKLKFPPEQVVKETNGGGLMLGFFPAPYNP